MSLSRGGFVCVIAVGTVKASWIFVFVLFLEVKTAPCLLYDPHYCLASSATLISNEKACNEYQIDPMFQAIDKGT